MVSTIGLGAGVECFVFFFLHLVPYKNNKSYPLYRKDKEQKKMFPLETTPKARKSECVWQKGDTKITPTDQKTLMLLTETIQTVWVS